MEGTKDRIITEALRLFSEKGYGEVTVSQIAEAVGIKPPSLYKHFQSKQDIFDAIKGRMSDHYMQMVSGLGIDGNNASADIPIYDGIGEDELVQIGRSLFTFFLRDEDNSRFRRMLSIGRYSDPELDSMFHSQYIDLPLSYQSEIFRGMLESRGMDGDPRTMALEFYSPMLILLMSCDTDPGREEEALGMVEDHIRHFSRVNFGVIG